MRLEELNWMDVQQYLAHDDRVMLVLGSCEQHGYLSLQTDVRIPLALADAASQQTGVLVAPPLNFGCSPYFLAYPGTLSLRVTTLLEIVEDLALSLSRQGFHRLLFLNGHGGNDAACIRLYEVADRTPGLQVAWYDWFQSHAVEAICMEHGLKPTHANWMESFSFTQVSELPEDEKIPPYVPGIIGADQAKQIYGDGSFGGPYKVADELMQSIFTAALADVLQLLKF